MSAPATPNPLQALIDAGREADRLRSECAALIESERSLTRLLARAVHALGPIRWSAPFEDMPAQLTLRYTDGEIDVVRADGSSVSKPQPPPIRTVP